MEHDNLDESGPIEYDDPMANYRITFTYLQTMHAFVFVLLMGGKAISSKYP